MTVQVVSQGVVIASSNRDYFVFNIVNMEGCGAHGVNAQGC